MQRARGFEVEAFGGVGWRREEGLVPGAFLRAARSLGTGKQVSAQDTVPFCLWAASRHIGDYIGAMWFTACGFGDIDTTCAIVGGIVALTVDALPEEWLARREPLPPR